MSLRLVALLIAVIGFGFIVAMALEFGASALVAGILGGCIALAVAPGIATAWGDGR